MLHDHEKSVISSAITKLGSRKGFRATAETRWQKIAKVLDPADNWFFNTQVTEGMGMNQYKITASPQTAAQRCASAIISLIAPESQPWHGLDTFDLSFMDNPDNREYLQKASKLLHRYRYAANTSFNNELYGAIYFAAVYGTGVLYTSENLETQNVNYRNTHIREHYFQPNTSGIIDDNIREFKMYPEELMQRYYNPEDPNRIPAIVRAAAENGVASQFDVMHCVHVNPVYNPFDPMSKRFISYDILESTQTLLRVGGYNTFPFHVFMMYKNPLEVYGRGFGDLTYEEIMTANQIRAQDLFAKEMASAPPTLMMDAARRDIPIFMPRTVMPGGLDEQGNPRYKPYINSPYPNIATDALMQSIGVIQEGFMLNLFSVLSDAREMTLGEVELRQREKLMQAAPLLQGLQMNNGLASIVLREFDIHNSFGHFGPVENVPSDLLVDGRIEVRFEAPMNQIQRSVEVEKTMRYIQSLAVLQPVLPEIMDYLNEESIVDELTQGFGVETKLVRSPEEVEAIRAARRQQEQVGMAMGAAESLSKTQLNLSRANRDDRTI